MVKELTMKTKKDDMLKAYNELADEFAKKKKEIDNTPIEPTTKNQIKKEKKSEKYTVETIVKQLANLKLDLNKTLTDISDRLLSEVNTLEAIKKEINVEKEQLNTIHNIQFEADSMQSLMQMHEDKKRSIEQEMVSIKNQWEKEQKEYELAIKERDEKHGKEKEREQEEYNYNISMKRKKEKDTYEEEKTLLQKNLAKEKELKMKDLQEREAKIQTQEEEIVELKERAKNFPIELSKTIENVKQETKHQIEKEMKQKEELQRKETEGNINVYELKIKNLENILMKQTIQIEGLSQQVDTSSKHVLNIANKAIEGASGYKTATSFAEELFRESSKDEKIKK